MMRVITALCLLGSVTAFAPRSFNARRSLAPRSAVRMAAAR